MRGMTTNEAASAGGCAKSTIYELIKLGAIKAEQDLEDRLRPWTVLSTQEEVREAVRKFAPTSTGDGSRPRHKRKVTPRLAPALELLSEPADKRAILLRISRKFTIEDLRVIAGL